MSKMNEFDKLNNDYINPEDEVVNNEQKKEKSFARRLASVGAKTVCFGLVAGFVFGFSVPFASNYLVPKLQQQLTPEDQQLTVSTLDQAVTDSVEGVSMDTASANTVEVIKKVKPSIVCITSISQSSNIFSGTYETEGSGSGIMFYKDDSKVYIATNNHVISGAKSVSISIDDSEELIPATLVGKDSNADLAVISVAISDITKAGITNIQLATFGDSDSLQVGESVIAIGNALGNGNTATAGIVSAVQKDVNIQGRTLSVIQTDAAINPGNSGGALVNSKGQVIGINTAKIALDSVEGIGYSITSNVAKPIIEQLMNSTDTPTLGVYITSITEDVATQYGLPQAGVLIQQIIQGGSAYNSGLQAGDIITSYNGNAVFTTDQLMSAVKASKVGDTVKITVVRDGQTKTIDVKLTKGNSSF
jgi:serine protease Do